MPQASVAVKDTVGDGNHFQVTVVSTDFEGKTLVEQHKMVYQALSDLDLHAIGLKTSSPGEGAIYSSQ